MPKVKIVFSYRKEVADFENFIKRRDAVVESYLKIGHGVINAKVEPEDINCLSFNLYVMENFEQFDKYDVLYLMEGWEKDQKAKWEHTYAKKHGKRISYEKKKPSKLQLAALEYMDKKGNVPEEVIARKYGLKEENFKKRLPLLITKLQRVIKRT
jgi:hypothetical protein